MNCPDCKSADTRVISTDHVDNKTTWRYIRCLECGAKFKTEEKYAERLKTGPRPWKDNYKCKPINPAKGESVASSVLTEANVLHMRALSEQGCSRQEIIKYFGVSASTVDRILKRKYWKHI